MSAGKEQTGRIPKAHLWDDYFTNLRSAYGSMRNAFRMRAREGLTQDGVAEMLGVDKSLVSRRLRGEENLTLKTLSFMATAMKCRLSMSFVPYEHVGLSENQSATQSAPGDIPLPISTSELTSPTNAPSFVPQVGNELDYYYEPQEQPQVGMNLAFPAQSNFGTSLVFAVEQATVGTSLVFPVEQATVGTSVAFPVTANNLASGNASIYVNSLFDFDQNEHTGPGSLSYFANNQPVNLSYLRPYQATAELHRKDRRIADLEKKVAQLEKRNTWLEKEIVLFQTLMPKTNRSQSIHAPESRASIARVVRQHQQEGARPI